MGVHRFSAAAELDLLFRAAGKAGATLKVSPGSSSEEKLSYAMDEWNKHKQPPQPEHGRVRHRAA